MCKRLWGTQCETATKITQRYGIDIAFLKARWRALCVCFVCETLAFLLPLLLLLFEYHLRCATDTYTPYRIAFIDSAFVFADICCRLSNWSRLYHFALCDVCVGHKYYTHRCILFLVSSVAVGAVRYVHVTAACSIPYVFLSLLFPWFFRCQCLHRTQHRHTNSSDMTLLCFVLSV